MAKPKKTHEEFISEMNEINSNILILGKYIGARDKVKCKCLIDGNEWEAMPTNLLKGKGCPECKRRKNNKTHKQFMEEFYYKNPNANNIDILSKYKRIDSKIDCRCKICGHTWSAKPNGLLEGKGCKICGIERQKQKND